MDDEIEICNPPPFANGIAKRIYRDGKNSLRPLKSNVSARRFRTSPRIFIAIRNGEASGNVRGTGCLLAARGTARHALKFPDILNTEAPAIRFNRPVGKCRKICNTPRGRELNAYKKLLSVEAPQDTAHWHKENACHCLKR